MQNTSRTSWMIVGALGFVAACLLLLLAGTLLYFVFGVGQNAALVGTRETPTLALSLVKSTDPTPTTTIVPTSTPRATETPIPTITMLPPTATFEPSATPTALVAKPPCPEWFVFPEAGKGLLVIENHVGMDNMIDAAPPLNWSKLMPAKKEDLPSRMVLQLSPGNYVFNTHTIPKWLKGRLTVSIQAGEMWISPLYWYSFVEVLLPLEVPPGCK